MFTLCNINSQNIRNGGDTNLGNVIFQGHKSQVTKCMSTDYITAGNSVYLPWTSIYQRHFLFNKCLKLISIAVVILYLPHYIYFINLLNIISYDERLYDKE